MLSNKMRIHRGLPAALGGGAEPSPIPIHARPVPGRAAGLGTLCFCLPVQRVSASSGRLCEPCSSGSERRAPSSSGAGAAAQPDVVLSGHGAEQALSFSPCSLPGRQSIAEVPFQNAATSPAPQNTSPASRGGACPALQDAKPAAGPPVLNEKPKNVPGGGGAVSSPSSSASPPPPKMVNIARV